MLRGEPKKQHLSNVPNAMFGSFGRRGEQRGVEGMRVVERRVERNGYPPPYLDVFKIK